jgi:hypothetical protein
MSAKPFDLLSAFIFRIHVMAPNERFGKLPAEAMRREQREKRNLLKLDSLTAGSSRGI